MLTRVFRDVLAGLAALAIARAAAAQTDTSMSSARAEAQARAQADSLRRVVLGLATYAGFVDSSACAPGDVRTFENDTADVVKNALAALEVLVLSHGAFVPLDNEAGRALMRAALRLEMGGPGPRWDTISGLGPRSINPFLPTRLLNSETKECKVWDPGNEPDGIVLPAPMTGFLVPRDSGAFNATVGYGPGALNDIRNFFFSRNRTNPNAVLKVTRVNAYGIWGDYAIIGVTRDRQRQGAVPLPKETTGATYAFHRVGSEWRLLAVIKDW
ncbi:MAG TPA: hypothetical protein VE967_00890 [Gemmatimonadaceae bacterium]|nr:hypothetical protein [Gemmatimonadaceae bacterium]